MAMTDAEVAMACDAWLSDTDMTDMTDPHNPVGTIFKDGWPDERIIWPNAPTMVGVTILPRVEVQFMTVQPQQLGLGLSSTARRQFIYVPTLVAKSQGYQYPAQVAADILARRFLFGTRLKDAPDLWVRAPVRTGPGYQDGTEWRVPVTINLETLAKI